MKGDIVRDFDDVPKGHPVKERTATENSLAGSCFYHSEIGTEPVCLGD